MTAAVTVTLKPLRPHQHRAIDGVRQALMTGATRPVLQLPTGAGTTVIAAHMIAGVLRAHKRVAFCVPRLGLIDQTVNRFIENGIDAGSIGVVQADHPWRRAHAQVQVCSAQTLSRRGLPTVDWVIIDECHEQHKVYADWMADASWQTDRKSVV